MPEPLRLGIAGLGTVGSAVLRLLAQNGSLLAERPGRDLVVELIGGADGPALALCRAALEAGKPVVTANKALLAHHGAELAALAEANHVTIGFQAALAGGIPIVKTLR